MAAADGAAAANCYCLLHYVGNATRAESQRTDYVVPELRKKRTYKNTPGPWFVRFSLVRFSFVRNFKTPPKYLVRAQSFIGARNNEGNKHQ